MKGRALSSANRRFLKYWQRRAGDDEMRPLIGDVSIVSVEKFWAINLARQNFERAGEHQVLALVTPAR